MSNRTVQVEIIDRESLNYLVRELDNFETDKVIREGLLDATGVFKAIGGNLLRQRMKRPEGVTGNLLASFTRRVKKGNKGVLIGFRHANSDLSFPNGAHAHLVDQGTGQRSTGIMPANHFWEDAKDMGESNAIAKLYTSVEKRVDDINNKR